jgi:hypothetical protein
VTAAALILLPTTVPTGLTDLPTGPTLAEETEPPLVRRFNFSVDPFASLLRLLLSSRRTLLSDWRRIADFVSHFENALFAF